MTGRSLKFRLGRSLYCTRRHLKDFSRAASLACALGLAVLVNPLPSAHAHKGHSHKPDAAPPAPSQAASPTSREESTKLLYIDINESYSREVKPIFQRSCFDCHSSSTRYPWYSNLPIAKTIIRDDIEEAKSHLDFSEGFPFKSHSTPKEDLEAVRDSVQNGSMPPFRYRALHWGAGLSEEEKATVVKWANEALARLAPEPGK